MKSKGTIEMEVIYNFQLELYCEIDVQDLDEKIKQLNHDYPNCEIVLRRVKWSK